MAMIWQEKISCDFAVLDKFMMNKVKLSVVVPLEVTSVWLSFV
jgi:hypothetical protein